MSNRIPDYVSILSGGLGALAGTASTGDAVLTADAKLMLRQFGEEVTYYPGAGGSRVIKAIVNRKVPQPIEGSPPGAMGKLVQIGVANASTSTSDDSYGGIASDEIDLGLDEIALEVRIGQSAKRLRMRDMNLQDDGMIQITLS